MNCLVALILTGVTQFVCGVQIAQSPLVIWDALTFKFRVQFEIIPAGRFDQIIGARCVLETV